MDLQLRHPCYCFTNDYEYGAASWKINMAQLHFFFVYPIRKKLLRRVPVSAGKTLIMK